MRNFSGAIRRCGWLSLMLLAVAGTAAALEPHWVARFSVSDTAGWTRYVYAGETTYALAESTDGVALQAHSRGTASAYYRDVSIDLTQQPVLRWRWRVDSGPSGLEELTRQGDDYAARVYVVHKRGLLRKPYIINYVWSGSQLRGAVWPNAWLPEHSIMVAVRGSGDQHGRWYSEMRNVRDDFRNRLGVDVDRVDVLVFMTDTDNQQGEATAWYGDAYFESP